MYERILIVVEDDPSTEAALAEGLALARLHGAEAVLYAVMPATAAPATDLPAVGLLSYEQFDQAARLEAQRRLATAADLADKARVRHRQLVGLGVDAVQAIANQAQEMHCDLIIVGTEGRNAVMRLLTGSLVPGLITHAPVPVLVCRHSSPGARLLHQADHGGQLRRKRRAGVGPLANG